MLDTCHLRIHSQRVTFISPSPIHSCHIDSVVTELLQCSQCVVPASTLHSGGVGVGESTARSLVGEHYLIAAHNIVHWLGPGEGDGSGGLGIRHYGRS